MKQYRYTSSSYVSPGDTGDLMAIMDLSTLPQDLIPPPISVPPLFSPVPSSATSVNSVNSVSEGKSILRERKYDGK